MPPEIAVVPPTSDACSTSSTRCRSAAATHAAVMPAAPAPTTMTSKSVDDAGPAFNVASLTWRASPTDSSVALHHAAVGLNDLAVDPRRLLGAEEAHDLGHLLRAPDAVERAQRARARLHLVGLAGTEQLGVHRTRRNGVDAHAPRRELLGQCSHQHFHGRLGGRVRART